MTDLEEIKKEIKPVLSSGALIRIAIRVLYNINKEIVRHTERTSYLVMKLAQNHTLPEKCSIRNLVFLSLFHTIGFFREDIFFGYNPHDSNIDYFSHTKAVESKYMFACYYLEFMTPVHKDAIALENFMQPYNKDLKKFIYQEEYKSIIRLCAHISDFIVKNPDTPIPKDLDTLALGLDPEYKALFCRMNQDNELENSIRWNTYEDDLNEFIDQMEFSEEDNKILQKLLIYLLDFKSTVTMSHSLNTSCYALSIGYRMGLNTTELSTLFTSAILHDIGKIATPQRILEFPGRLTPEDMGIMRYHVNHSKRILNGLVPQEIMDNVFRHHEKLNGSGYPMHLTAESLTLAQRILTVADITSALSDSRSYKGEFSKEKTVSIIKEMTEKGELDPSITKIVENEFDSLKTELPSLQTLLKVDFSNVLGKYNDYLVNMPQQEEIYNVEADLSDDDLEEI